MGLRDRLKHRVRRLVEGETPAKPPPPPRRQGLARPPAVVPAPVTAEPPPAAAVRPPAPEPPGPEPPAPEPPAPEPLAPEAAVEEAPVEDAPSPDDEVWFESDYATTDAPSRTAHHRDLFETTDRALKVRVFDSELDRWLEFRCEPGEYVLDAADRAGLELPFSCRSGGCLSCAGKLLEGVAELGEQYVLEEEHVEAGFRLLCCTTVSKDSVFLGNQEDEID